MLSVPTLRRKHAQRLLCFCVLILFLFTTPAHPGEASPEWGEVRHALQRWRSSFANITFRWTERFSEDPEVRAENELIWTDQNWIRHERILFRGASITRRHLKISAASKTSHWEYSEGERDPDRPARVTINGRSREEQLFLPLFVMLNPEDQRWIFEPDLTRPPSEQHLATITTTTAGVFRELPVAEKHGFILEFSSESHRLWKSLFSYVGGRAQSRRLEMHIDEFRQLQPDFWIPWKGHAGPGRRIGSSREITWEMTSVDLNRVLGAGVFQPQIPNTSDLHDFTTNFHRKSMATIAKEQALRAKRQAAPQLVEGDVNTVPALGKNNTRQASYVLAMVSAICLSAGVTLFYLKKSRSPASGNKK